MVLLKRLCRNINTAFWYLEWRESVRPRSWITYWKCEQKLKRLHFQAKCPFFFNISPNQPLDWSLSTPVWPTKTKKIHSQTTLFESSLLRICPAATFISLSCLSLPSVATVDFMIVLLQTGDTYVTHRRRAASLSYGMIPNSIYRGGKYGVLGTRDIAFNGLFVSCERKKEKKKMLCLSPLHVWELNLNCEMKTHFNKNIVLCWLTFPQRVRSITSVWSKQECIYSW